MFELTINGVVYQFRFGIGFTRELNKKIKQPVDGLKGVEKCVGLRYKIAGIIDGDIEDLIEVLDTANKTESPRIKKEELEAFIEDEETDIDQLFEDVKNFLSKANATKKEMRSILEAVEKEKEKQEALEAARAEKM